MAYLPERLRALPLPRNDPFGNMATRPSSDAVDFDTMVNLVSSILSELNVGLLIYRLENPDRPDSLRLAYANRVASEYTRADLSGLIGKTIGEAFPALAASELPEIYAEVARTKHPRNVGAFAYEGDGRVAPGHFSVKAFPMPNDCVGIVFENITVRKQLEEMVKRQRKGDEPAGRDA